MKQIRKKVDKRCADTSVFALVESQGRACFGQCPQPRNTSSACYTRCFFTTVVGPRAGDGIGPNFIQGGVEVSALEQAWSRPFESERPAEGGCPALSLKSDDNVMPPELQVASFDLSLPIDSGGAVKRVLNRGLVQPSYT
eukprot:SAG22_NODE_150_length_17426_cov_8.082588_10_plen_140_part_00